MNKQTTEGIEQAPPDKKHDSLFDTPKQFTILKKEMHRRKVLIV